MGDGCHGVELSKVKVFLDSPIIVTLNDEVKLMTADEKTVIAEFHRVHLFDKKEKARIEVHSAGMSMLDHIVLTFVFVGQARREREVAVRSTVPFNWLVG